MLRDSNFGFHKLFDIADHDPVTLLGAFVESHGFVVKQINFRKVGEADFLSTADGVDPFEPMDPFCRT